VADKRDKKAKAEQPSRDLLKYAWRFFLGMTLLVTVLFATVQTNRFLIRDPRFTLNGPEEFGHERPNLRIDGLHYASRSQIVKAFEKDFGRSVYLLPLADRRQEILKIDWVKDATVMRIWPDQLDVRVTERKPVAFLASSYSQVWLIDDEGAVLHPPLQARFRLPVLQGVSPTEAPTIRHDRVRRMLRVLKESGDRAEKISEIDLAEPENVRATMEASGQALTLMLGDHHYGARLDNFFAHYPDIQKRKPEARVFDLRLEDRIIVVR
jgi:cell division protein FtsQ